MSYILQIHGIYKFLFLQLKLLKFSLILFLITRKKSFDFTEKVVKLLASS